MQGAREGQERQERQDGLIWQGFASFSGLQFCHLFFFFFLSSLPLEEVEERRGVSKMLKASKFCGGMGIGYTAYTMRLYHTKTEATVAL